MKIVPINAPDALPAMSASKSSRSNIPPCFESYISFMTPMMTPITMPTKTLIHKVIPKIKPNAKVISNDIKVQTK